MTKISFDLTNINGNNGFLISGIKFDQALLNNPQDPLSTVSLTFLTPQGDINGDNLDDLTIQSSVILGDNGVFQENFILFGTNLLSTDFNVQNISNNNGLVINNTITESNLFSDVNGDGIDDLITASLDLNGENTLNYVLLGNNGLSGTLNPSDLNGDNGFTITDNNGVLTPLNFQGDINNDGIDDLIFLSLSNTEGITNTANKIVFGQQIFLNELNISSLNGNNGFVVGGKIIFNSGGVDVNGDEIEDLIFIDNDLAENYVLFGNENFPANVDVTGVNGNNGFTITDSSAGVNDRLSGVLIEDFNGDGIGDFVIQKRVVSNANSTELEPNKLYILFGQNGNFPNTIDVANLNGTNGFSLASALTLEQVVDINGDSLQDLIVEDAESIYVIFGGSGGFSSTLNLSNLNGSNGFRITNSNITVKEVGDVNGDAIDDLIIDTENNITYVLLGQESFNSTVDLSDNNNNILEVTGQLANNGIANVSDFNGDGFDDLVFNPVIDNNATSATATSGVVLGTQDLNTLNQPSDTIELYRFKNTTFNTGTYLFVGAQERNNILNNPDFNETFQLEGNGNPAFKASTIGGENFIPFFRLQSLDVPGTFLFVSTEEYNAIFADNSDQQGKWIKEGFDQGGVNDIPEFYLYGAGANQGLEFHRFQNNDNNTFLFAGPDETKAINNDLNLSTNFSDQGVAFESLI